jgi:DNA-binding CsgD family transcriptional regulator
VEEICQVSREEFCGRSKSAAAVRAKEMLILSGLRIGASRKELAEIAGISDSTVSRRCDAIRLKVEQNATTRELALAILKQYRSRND